MTKKILKKYLTDGFFLNAPIVITTVFALVTLPIALTNLPIADYGKFQFVLALQAWLLALAAGNITAASKRGIAQGLNGTFLYAFLARIKLLVPAGILMLVTALYFKISGKEVFSILFTIIGLYLIFGYLFHISFYEFLIAQKRFKELCFWQILISFVSMVGSATIAYFTSNIFYYALFQLWSVGILGCIAWFWIVKKERLIASYKKGEIEKECAPYGLKLIPVALISITAGRLSLFIIGSFFGFANLAVFSVANKLRDKCAGIIKSVHPLLYADFAKLEREELIKVINPYLLKIGCLGVLLTFAFLGMVWFYVVFFLPQIFHQAILFFAILVLGLPVGILTIILHTILESHLRHKELTVIGIIPNLIRIALILVFGYFWQIIGICIALAISGWISFGFYYFLTIRKELTIRMVEKYPLLKRAFSF